MKIDPTQFNPGLSIAGYLKEDLMDSVIYLVGLVVVVMVILSFLGLR